MKSIAADQLSDEQRRRLVEVGKAWAADIQAHRDVVLSIYTPLACSASKDGVRVQRDLPYGEDPRQVADVFAPATAQACDLVIFVHGGAFVRGNKRVNEEIYDNVCYWFARQGVVAVNIEYRLATEAPYPGGAEDVALAVEWCVEHASEFGADANRLFLIGHSAGATHVGTYLADPVMGRSPPGAVAGAVMLSGRLRADARPENPNAGGVRSYFGEDESLYERRSPVAHAHRTKLPIMLAIAEYENPLLDVYGLEYAHRLAATRGRAPEFVRMKGHNHTSMVAHFNTGEEGLGRQILQFMADCKRVAPPPKAR